MLVELLLVRKFMAGFARPLKARMEEHASDFW